MKPDSPNHIPGLRPDVQALPWNIDRVLAAQMAEVIRRLDEIDKRLGALECKVEAAEKARLLKMLDDRAEDRCC